MEPEVFFLAILFGAIRDILVRSLDKHIDMDMILCIYLQKLVSIYG
jgi:hypothetical protein